MPGFFSNIFRPKVKSRAEIIDNIDEIVRESINRSVTTKQIPQKRGTIITADKGLVVTGPLSNSVAVGKLKKTLAPNRAVLPSGMFTNRFNMSDLYSAYIGENLVKFTIDKYTEATIRSGHFIKSKNLTVIKYLQKRLREIAYVSKSSFDEYVSDFMTSLMLYGNSYAVKHRQKEASSGRPYVDSNGKMMTPIASLYVEDPRKLILGEGPGGRMRYVRVSYDVHEIDLNAMNPSLFTSSEEHQSGIPFFYTPQFGGFLGLGRLQSSISSLFKSNSRREVEYVVYEDYEIDHIRYRHVPGEKIAMPPFWPTLNDIDSLRRIEENIELLVYNYGHPILHAKVGESTMPGDDSEVLAVQSKLEEMESNGFIATSNRVLIDMIGAESSALRVEAYLKYFQQRVLTGLWLSEVAVGIGDTSNRSTANVLDKLAQEKVRELQSIFVNHINNVFIELLLEAGLDIGWILDPENIPCFEFNEIDLEGKIRKEAHIINLWQGNMITSAEMRADLGRDPLTPEQLQDTYLERVSIPLAEAGKTDPMSSSAKTTQTNTAPKNQNGTAGPKKGINRSSIDDDSILW
jgi:hypothetical protein